MRTGVKQEVIRMAVAIKIRHTYQVKAHWKSRATRPSDMNIATHVPNRCLASARIVKDKIRLPIVVKVSIAKLSCYWSRSSCWLKSEKVRTRLRKGGSRSARRKFVDFAETPIGHKEIVCAVNGQTRSNTESVR